MDDEFARGVRVLCYVGQLISSQLQVVRMRKTTKDFNFRAVNSTYFTLDGVTIEINTFTTRF